MCKSLDVQIMRVIDVLADLEHHRQRMRGPQVRTNHIGQVLANGFGDFARVSHGAASAYLPATK